MSTPESTPSLDSYSIEYNTFQSVSVGSTDPETAYVKNLSVRVLKYGDDDSKPPVEVGTATGLIVLGELASEEGSSLSETCDEHSGDLEAARAAIEEYFDLSDDENLLYVEEIEIVPADNNRELRIAVFEEIVRLAGLPFRFAATYSEGFGEPAGADPLAVEDSRRPEGTTFLSAEGMLIWERGEQGWSIIP